MTAPTHSYRKVFYDLRPAKQVERRMIVDVLQELGEGGFHLRDYEYTGFGSIYFVDFILLHRLLGLRKLLSVEIAESAESRVQFNKPFGDVKVRMGAIGDVLPSLDRDQRRILWLDYDHRLIPTDLQDLVVAGQVLAPGSIVLITVDVEPRSEAESPSNLQRYYEDIASDFLPFDLEPEAFTHSQLAHTNARIILNAIRQGVVARPSVGYLPLFSFTYSDGHRMLTVGGLIGGDAHVRQIEGTRLSSLPFVRRNGEDAPYEIKVPRLTRKERSYLDRHMPCADNWLPSEFELPAEEVLQYREIYRYYPVYAELLL